MPVTGDPPDASTVYKALLDARARNEGLLGMLRDLIEAGDGLNSSAMLAEDRLRWAALRITAKRRFPELCI